MFSRLPSLLPTTRRLLANPIIANGGPSKIVQRSYKNFGHKKKPEPLITTLFCLFLLSGVVGTMVDWRWCRMLYYYSTGQLKTKEKDSPEIEE